MTRQIAYLSNVNIFVVPFENMHELQTKSARSKQVIPTVGDQLIGWLTETEKYLTENALNEMGLEIGDEVPGTRNLFQIIDLKCMRNFCTRLATKQTILTFKARPDMPEETRASAITGIFICDEHAEPDPELYITHPGWQKIIESFQQHRLMPPDRRTLKVLFRPLPKKAS